MFVALGRPPAKEAQVRPWWRVNVLVHENLSPKLVQLLAAKGVAAVHIGMQGATDPEVWEYAFNHDQIVVTVNAADFLQTRGVGRLAPRPRRVTSKLEHQGRHV